MSMCHHVFSGGNSEKESVTFIFIIYLVLGLSGVESSPQRLPLKCCLTVLLNVLHTGGVDIIGGTLE